MREIGGARVYRGWKFWDEGDWLEGTYVSMGEDNYGNPSYTVKVDAFEFADPEKGISPDGAEVKAGCDFVLNSNGSLNYKMQSVEEGTKIKVLYDGTDVMQKGKFKGKEFHVVRLFAADGQEVEQEAEEADPFKDL